MNTMPVDTKIIHVDKSYEVDIDIERSVGAPFTNMVQL